MRRKIISLLLVLSLIAIFVCAGSWGIHAAPGNGGEVDPTGLDLRASVSDVHEVGGSPASERELVIRKAATARNEAARWIERFLIRALVNRLSF